MFAGLDKMIKLFACSFGTSVLLAWTALLDKKVNSTVKQAMIIFNHICSSMFMFQRRSFCGSQFISTVRQLIVQANWLHFATWILNSARLAWSTWHLIRPSVERIRSLSSLPFLLAQTRRLPCSLWGPSRLCRRIAKPEKAVVWKGRSRNDCRRSYPSTGSIRPWRGLLSRCGAGDRDIGAGGIGGVRVFMEYGLGGRLGTGLVRGKGPCSDDVPTLPWVRSRVWVKVELGSELATGKGWV